MPPRKLHLSDGLALPLDAITRTFGIVGQRGSGKSTTGATFVEQIVMAGGRAVVFDPTGVWYGLTRAGTGPGLPGVVLGGEHADAPLMPGTGAVVAEFVIGSDYPLIVLDMKLMRKGQRQHFAMEFLEALYHDNREPLMVVFDESPQFAPQMMRGKGEDEVVPRLLGAVEDVVSLGRSRGLGVTLIAQRIAMVNANVREQVETLVAHRLMGKLDRTALKGWIEAQADPEREKEVLEVIAKLATGRALVWSPAFLDYFGVVNVHNATTFDSRATPKVGQKVKRPGKRAPVDLDTLRTKMAATIEEAEANDPKKLRQQLAEARREIERASKVYETDMAALRLQLDARPAETVTVEVPVITDKELERVEGIVRALESAHGIVATGYAELRDVVFPLASNVKDALNARTYTRPADPPRVLSTTQRKPQPSATGSASSASTPPTAPRSAPEAAAESGASGGASDNGSLTNSEQRVLNAIAWYGILGNDRPNKQQVGFVAGYRVGPNVGGTFGNLLGRLRSQGYLDYPSPGTVTLTAQGREVAHAPAIEPTNESVQDAVRALLKPVEVRVLDVLIEAWPNPMRKQEIGERAGYTVGPNVGGTFGNILGRLRGTLGVIEYPTPGEARASDVLFPLA